ncbi:ATP-binding cassette domain-containing protein [Amedibacillus sp. YH-ame10]
MNVVKVSRLSKSFNDVKVFEDFNLEIEEGTITIINGPSGCGKSTLLNMLGLLDKPDKGDITLFGISGIKPFSKKAEKMLTEKLGYLFQNFALVEDETVEYNLLLAMENLKGIDKKAVIGEALARVGLKDYEKKKIYKCSGGEQQRVAIARLLLKPCELVLADEPTGSLDAENKMLVVSLLKELQQMGKTIIIVTHDQELMGIGNNHIKLTSLRTA